MEFNKYTLKFTNKKLEQQFSEQELKHQKKFMQNTFASSAVFQLVSLIVNVVVFYQTDQSDKQRTRILFDLTTIAIFILTVFVLQIKQILIMVPYIYIIESVCFSIIYGYLVQTKEYQDRYGEGVYLQGVLFGIIGHCMNLAPNYILQFLTVFLQVTILHWYLFNYKLFVEYDIAQIGLEIVAYIIYILYLRKSNTQKRQLFWEKIHSQIVKTRFEQLLQSIPQNIALLNYDKKFQNLETKFQNSICLENFKNIDLIELFKNMKIISEASNNKAKQSSMVLFSNQNLHQKIGQQCDLQDKQNKILFGQDTHIQSMLINKSSDAVTKSDSFLGIDAKSEKSSSTKLTEQRKFLKQLKDTQLKGLLVEYQDESGLKQTARLNIHPFSFNHDEIQCMVLFQQNEQQKIIKLEQKQVTLQQFLQMTSERLMSNPINLQEIYSIQDYSLLNKISLQMIQQYGLNKFFKFPAEHTQSNSNSNINKAVKNVRLLKMLQFIQGVKNNLQSNIQWNISPSIKDIVLNTNEILIYKLFYVLIEQAYNFGQKQIFISCIQESEQVIQFTIQNEIKQNITSSQPSISPNIKPSGMRQKQNSFFQKSINRSKSLQMLSFSRSICSFILGEIGPQRDINVKKKGNMYIVQFKIYLDIQCLSQDYKKSNISLNNINNHKKKQSTDQDQYLSLNKSNSHSQEQFINLSLNNNNTNSNLNQNSSQLNLKQMNQSTQNNNQNSSGYNYKQQNYESKIIEQQSTENWLVQEQQLTQNDTSLSQSCIIIPEEEKKINLISQFQLNFL